MVDFPKLQIGGIAIDCATTRQVIDHIMRKVGEGQGGIVVTPNLDHLALVRAKVLDRDILTAADLVVADGMPLVWASRLAGTPLPERVAGSELLPGLCEAAAIAGTRVVFLGGRPGAGDRAAGSLSRRFPGLSIVGTPCPPLGFERTEAGLAAVVDELRSYRPDLVFTALGTPKQELFNAWLRSRFPGSWLIGCGAALDMEAGFVRQAPVWLRRIGGEWLWRLALEPRRLASRYLVRDLPSAAWLMREALRTRTAGMGRGRKADTARGDRNRSGTAL